MTPKRILKWETKELLRAFKRLDGKVPKVARPYIAAFLWKWKRDFGRKDVKTMLLEWQRIDSLVGVWRLVIPKEGEDDTQMSEVPNLSSENAQDHLGVPDMRLQDRDRGR